MNASQRLIFNIKGNVGQTVNALAQETQRTVVRIGPGWQPMNLLAGLTGVVAQLRFKFRLTV